PRPALPWTGPRPALVTSGPPSCGSGWGRRGRTWSWWPASTPSPWSGPTCRAAGGATPGRAGRTRGGSRGRGWGGGGGAAEGGGGRAELGEGLGQARADLELVARLDAIPLERANMQGGRWDNAGADRKYAEAFAEAGLGQVGDDEDAVAQRVADSPVREALV